MKQLLKLILLQAVFLLISPQTKADGTVKDYQFFSKALHREMTCRVYLPGDYEPNNPGNRFPVIYFLHGANLGYDQYDLVFPILDNLINFQLIKPVIFILPDGLAPPYAGSFYTNSALYGNFEDYITYDLISFIDSTFHTKKVRGQRAIMGASMGGYGALKIALRHPDLFVGVAGHSGPVNINMMDILIPDLVSEAGGTAPFHWSPGSGKPITFLTFTMAGAFSPNLNNVYQVDFPLDSMARPIPEVMERWRTENVAEIARTYKSGNNMGIRFDCGNLDEYHLHLQNRSLADTLTKYNIPFKYEEYLGTHTSGLPIRVPLSFAYFDELFNSSDASISLLQPELNWQVVPDPASGKLIIRRNSPLLSWDVPVINITDINGRLVLNQALTDSGNINVAGLPDGIYLFRIQCGSSIQTGKTIICH